ncbi:MAG: hypothetical protein A4E35_00938 [Methanoregula sp. PtaU1.Bin051]|nr:MAG: hypothetical protein A4E35_00938 [Methanoregula sp. PtaU1.Bin051]
MNVVIMSTIDNSDKKKKDKDVDEAPSVTSSFIENYYFSNKFDPIKKDLFGSVEKLRSQK